MSASWAHVRASPCYYAVAALRYAGGHWLEKLFTPGDRDNESDTHGMATWGEGEVFASPAPW